MNVLAASETIGNPVANIGIFGLFVVITLAVVIKAGKKNQTADDFFTGGRSFSGPQNGVAIAGDYLSAASFLGIAGTVTSRVPGDPILNAEMEVRSLTGVGAEKAASH